MEKNSRSTIFVSLFLVTAACQARDVVIEEQVESEPASALPPVGEISAGTMAHTRADPVPVRETRPCIVVRLIDGDTIECQGAGNVRLIGMDTPERSQDPYGNQATDALGAMLAGAKVTLEFDVELRDRYDRLLAYVWADSAMVNLALVRGGWAVVTTYPPNVQYVDWFARAQVEARDEGVGLWGIGGFDCLPYDRRRGRC